MCTYKRDIPRLGQVEAMVSLALLWVVPYDGGGGVQV